VSAELVQLMLGQLAVLSLRLRDPPPGIDLGRVQPDGDVSSLLLLADSPLAGPVGVTVLLAHVLDDTLHDSVELLITEVLPLQLDLIPLDSHTHSSDL